MLVQGGSSNSSSTTTLAPLTTINGINAKTVATTELYTVPAGKQLVITSVSVRTTAFTSGGKTINASGSVGKTGPDYNDYYDAGNLQAEKFTAVNQYFCMLPINASENTGVPVLVYQAGDIILLNIATGSNATLETWSVDILGYLL